MTVLLVEQNATTALSITSQVVVLNLGRVVLVDDAERVTNDVNLRRHYLGF